MKNTGKEGKGEEKCRTLLLGERDNFPFFSAFKLLIFQIQTNFRTGLKENVLRNAKRKGEKKTGRGGETGLRTKFVSIRSTKSVHT